MPVSVPLVKSEPIRRQPPRNCQPAVLILVFSVSRAYQQEEAGREKEGVSGIQPDFNGALIIIDGKESTAAAARSLSTDKIKSIRVLKGETATAAYGKKGEKGVIEVAVQ